MVGVTGDTGRRRSGFLQKPAGFGFPVAILTDFDPRKEHIPCPTAPGNPGMTRNALQYAVRLMGEARVLKPCFRNIRLLNGSKRSALQVHFVAFLAQTLKQARLNLPDFPGNGGSFLTLDLRVSPDQ